MAEIELSALVQQCFDRRISNQNILDVEAQDRTKEHNEKVDKYIVN